MGQGFFLGVRMGTEYPCGGWWGGKVPSDKREIRRVGGPLKSEEFLGFVTLKSKYLEY